MSEKICNICRQPIVLIWSDGELMGERCGCGTIDYLDDDGVFDEGVFDEGDDTVYGDDGWPSDMDDETKAWLSTNR
jgi:hypothetical protein